MNGIAVHHFGGTKADPFASTQALTLQDIDLAHKERWPDFKSSLGYWVGYNGIIFPDGSFVQTRLIGEETAAVIGYNTTVISFCLAGNFSFKDLYPIDRPTNAQRNTLINLCVALIQKNPASVGLKMAPGAILSVGLKDIHPHRFFAPTTQCYGDSLGDTWARDQVTAHYLGQLSYVRSLLYKLLDSLAQLRSGGLGSVEGRDCPCYL